MTTASSEWIWGTPLSGRAVAAGVRQSFVQFRAEFEARQTTVAIVRFEPPPDSDDLELARFDAARTSMEQKIKSFEFLGCCTEQISALPSTLSPPEFKAIIDRLNSDPNVRGIIVQHPVSRQLEPFVQEIVPGKDLDALSRASPFAVPATSEGIVRLVEPFAADALIAVVGAKGFVGKGVAGQLRDRGFDVLALDQRDPGFVQEDLLRVRDADIVISTTGQPELLDERHISPYHRLVVDSGFVKLSGVLYGDIRASARSIPQNYTPVPGGVGPVEMAVLMERLVSKELALEVEQWQLADTNAINYLTRSQVQQQQTEWATAIYPLAITAFVAKAQAQPDLSDGFSVQEGDYRLVLDRNASTFSIEGANGRGTLAAYSVDPKRIISAAGLTGSDVKIWHEIQQRMPLAKSRRGEREL